MSGVDAKRTIVSTSLNTCMDNSGIAAALFNVTFSPDDHMLSMHILGDSTISGNVTAEAQLTAYGFTVMKTSLDPCTTKGLMGLCPATEAPIDITFQEPLDASVVSNVPSECIALMVSIVQTRLMIARHRVHDPRPRWQGPSHHQR